MNSDMVFSTSCTCASMLFALLQLGDAEYQVCPLGERLTASFTAYRLSVILDRKRLTVVESVLGVARSCSSLTEIAESYFPHTHTIFGGKMCSWTKLLGSIDSRHIFCQELRLVPRGFKVTKSVLCSPQAKKFKLLLNVGTKQQSHRTPHLC
jgi:hypothetical protein